MKVVDFSIKRPMTIAVLVTVVLLLGAVSLSRLNIDLYPEMNLPVGAVITDYPGAGPQEVEKLVTRPLESVLGTVSNLDSIQSISTTGSSTVIVFFNWGTDMDFAALQMREKVDMVKSYLPDEASTPAVFKMDPNMLPIMQLVISGADPARVKQVTDDVIRPRLERVPGVAAVRVAGGVEREIKVLVDPAKLQGYGLTLSQIAGVLRAENMNVSAGQVLEGRMDMLVRVTGEFTSLDDIRQLVFTTPTGATVKLGDVAEVKEGVKEATQLSRVNGQPGLSLLIHKQSTANTVRVAREIKSALKDMRDDIPADFRIDVMLDQSDFIEQAIGNVTEKIFFGGLLAMLVMLVFLRNVRSTLIISTAIPISIIATFVLLYFNDMTLNLLSMGGLALGVGLIVDDAIVVLENIYRHHQQGLRREEAALVATAEVGNAVIAATLTTIAVFLPIVFVEGLASELFKPMALTVAFSVAASLAVALTLVPLLASRFLKLEQPDERKLWGRVYRFSEDRFNRFYDWYRRVLAWALEHRKHVIAGVAILFFGSLALVPVVGTEFMPSMDEGYVKVQFELPKGTSLAETDRYAAAVEKIGEEMPELVDCIFTNVGFTGSESMGGQASTDRGQVYFRLVEKDRRSLSSEEVAEMVRKRLEGIPGADFKVTATGPASEGQGMGAPVEITIKGDDLKVLADLAARAEEIVRRVPGTSEVSNSLEGGVPEVRVVADRARAAAYGLSGSEIASTVRTAIEGSVVTRYRTGGDEIDVRVQLKDASSVRLPDLENLVVTTPAGTQVPLRQVAELVPAEGPHSISRKDQSRVVSVTANLAGRDLGSVMKDIRAGMAELDLPPGYSVEYGGQNEEMVKAFGNLGLALILAVILVYLVMVAQFESLMHPFIIMFSVPVTITGVVVSLLVTGRTFSVPSFIGLILLAGIVVKNAIVLVDYINVLRHRGMERDEAILLAGPTRLRPILMTALTAILAMFPMALGLGEGGESQAPLATVIVGGLTFSSAITLVLVPVIYAVMDDLAAAFRRRHKAAVARGAEPK